MANSQDPRSNPVVVSTLRHAAKDLMRGPLQSDISVGVRLVCVMSP